MTYSLALKNGDLALSGSSVALVVNRDKLLQDLDCWLRERYRVDRFNPSYGSTLDDFVGQVMDDESDFYIAAEVRRVISNYQQFQLAKWQASPDLFTRAELIREVLSVSTKIQYDSVFVDVRIETMAFEQLRLATSLSA